MRIFVSSLFLSCSLLSFQASGASDVEAESLSDDGTYGASRPTISIHDSRKRRGEDNQKESDRQTKRQRVSSDDEAVESGEAPEDGKLPAEDAQDRVESTATAGSSQQGAVGLIDLPGDAVSVIISYLSPEALKAFRATSQNYKLQVDAYGSHAALELIKCWKATKGSSYSEGRQEQMYNVATQIACFKPSKELLSFMQHMFDQDPCIVIPKGDIDRRLLQHLRSVYGRRAHPRLLSSYFDYEREAERLALFEANIQDADLRKAALEHALSRFKVYGNLSDSDASSLASRLLAHAYAHRHYVDFDTAQRQPMLFENSFIVIGLERLYELRDQGEFDNPYWETPCNLLVDIDKTTVKFIHDDTLPLPRRISRLAFANSNKNLEGIFGAQELNSYKELREIDFSGLTKLEELNGFHLSNSNELISVDMSGLTSVESIDSGLNSMPKLRYADVSGLTALRETGGLFFMNCPSLTQFDLQSFISLENIGDPAFLVELSNLTTLNTSELKKVKCMGEGVFSDCSQLTSINTSGLERVERIEGAFLQNASRLLSFDTGPFVSLEEIGDNYLQGTESLLSFETNGFINLREIRDSFLEDSGIAHFRSSGLRKLETMGDNCLASCSNLRSFDASGFVSIKSIGPGFLYDSIPPLPHIFFKGVTPAFFFALQENNPDVVRRIVAERQLFEKSNGR